MKERLVKKFYISVFTISQKYKIVRYYYLMWSDCIKQPPSKKRRFYEHEKNKKVGQNRRVITPHETIILIQQKEPTINTDSFYKHFH